MEVFGPLKHAHSLMSHALEPLYAASPLSPAELDVLVMLRHTDEPAIARFLAEEVGCSRAGMSKTLAKLEGRGLITREPNPIDRRAALVHITAVGEAAVDAMLPRQLAAEARLLADVPPEAREQIVTALNLLVDVLHGAL
jgi:DNA-binding MarR family transcriptional regulator